MIQLKLLEIRDRNTFIPAFAFRAQANVGRDEEFGPFSAERFLLARSGYGTKNDSDCIVLGRLSGGGCHYDPYAWGGCRTMTTAHQWIEAHWDEISSGDVIDVEFIVGETTTRKDSERVTSILR